MIQRHDAVAEMRQDARPDDGPRMFTCRPWSPHEESWDDFMRAVERAYAQYVDSCRRAIAADSPGPEPAAPEPDPGGSR
jgi:hypothetical protein